MKQVHRNAYRWLLAGIGTTGLAGSLAGSFVSLYILVTAANITALIVFAIGQFAGIWLMFYGMAAGLRRFYGVSAYRWGLTVTAAFYGVLMWLGPTAAHLVGPLGLLFGLSQGIYWFAINILIYDTVEPDARVQFYTGWASLNAIVGVVAPLAGALIVTHGYATGHGSLGYHWLFATALALYLVAAALSWRMHPGNAVVRMPVRPAFLLPRVIPRWRLVSLSLWTSGVKDGVLSVAPVSLVFLATHRAMNLGEYGSLTAAAGLVSARFLQHRLRPDRWKSYLFVGVSGFVLAVLVLWWSVSWEGVLTYGVLMAFFSPVFTIPQSNQTLAIMDEDETIADRRALYVLSRENAVNGGRLLGLVFIGALMTWHGSAHMIAIVLLVVALLQYLQPWIASRLWPLTKGALRPPALRANKGGSAHRV